jgi:predicted glutamine amidotransferase
MCCLFGIVNYGQTLKSGQIKHILKVLSREAEVRGTDATGIAYNHGGRLLIEKRPLPAHKMKFHVPDHVHTIMGHTRMTTQGSEKRNCNNHPFRGQAGQDRFALAHNGVLSNDDRLQQQYKLPKSKIETDSYVAVQLIEHQKALSFDSLRFMAETVSGSFSFSILDDQNNVYLVKGDSPLSVLHFPHEKTYVFASTDEILYRSLIDSLLFDALKEREYEKVPITCGTILKICPDGKLETESFHFSHYVGRSWWEYGGYGMNEIGSMGKKSSMREAYIEELKIHAAYMGFDPDFVDELLEEGITPEELEDYIYYGDIGC